VCGRYIIREQEAAERYWRVHGLPTWTASFNVTPSALVPVIRRAGRIAAGAEDSGDDSGAAPADALAYEGALLRWGLVPYWSGGVAPKYSTFNARMERIETAPAFRGPWARSQRCILPASGFYEWQKRGAGKQPFFIKLADREQFGFAGLWDRSKSADGVIESCTIITMPANALLTEIHNTGHRMPAILREEDHEAWLSGSLDDARAALRPYADDLMLAYPVSPRVNSPKNDDEALIQPLTEPEPEADLFTWYPRTSPASALAGSEVGRSGDLWPELQATPDLQAKADLKEGPQAPRPAKKPS
jgi:putative SOS response-associated peptidase YedK